MDLTAKAPPAGSEDLTALQCNKEDAMGSLAEVAIAHTNGEITLTPSI